MVDEMSAEMLGKLRKLFVECAPGRIKQPSIPVSVWVLSPQQMADLRLSQDRFGIYAQRRALARALPGGVAVYRGDEWWHG